MKPMVVDLSHWDPANDYNAVRNAGIVGVIYKATQGVTYNDPTYKSQREKALAVGLKWGSYHFGDGNNISAQVSNYISFASPSKDELICLDWEDNPSSNMSLDQAKQFINDLEDRLGRRGECVLYSGNRAKDILGNRTDSYLGAHRLWLAQYGSTPVVQPSWKDWWLWQFTDGSVGPDPHTIPGIGPCDINNYDRSPEQLKAEWASGVRVPPVVEEPTVTITIEAPAGVRVVVTQK